MSDELELRSLRERVSKLEAYVRFLYNHLDVTFEQPPFELAPEDAPVAELIRQGDLMRAMATYRGIHHVDVGEAKAAVEEIRAGLGVK